MFPYNSFVGHIGGDDFIFIVESTPDYFPVICREVIGQFDREILSFFSEEEKAQSSLESEDRFGNRQLFNLTSLSIVGVYGDLSVFKTTENLARYMMKLKKEAKKIPFSSFMLHDADTLSE